MRHSILGICALSAVAATALLVPPVAAQDASKPNILVIFGDDIGQSNISAYSFGLMGYRTPNIDRIAREGMMFTDYYAEQSCTAGRSSFITGQATLRTGLSKVGMPGADGRPAAPRTSPSPRRSSRWATPPASSARTISATATSTCRPCTASTSSSATSTTSTPRRSRRTPTIPRTRHSRPSSGRAACSRARPPTPTSRRWTRVSARSAGRRSRTPGR